MLATLRQLVCCVECLVWVRGQGRRPETITASSHPRSVSGPGTSESGRGRDEARGCRGQARPGCSNTRPRVKGQSSQHCILQSQDWKCDWKYSLACLLLTCQGNNERYRNPITENLRCIDILLLYFNEGITLAIYCNSQP